MIKKIILVSLFMAAVCTSPAYAAKSTPKGADLGVDSRIKTLIYSDSEVYQVVARTGFQTQIEFGTNENIETISIGDPIGWQITPAGRRIFIKPLHKTGVTNLSVITNKRGYQFELISTDSGNRASTHAYLLRFYYPGIAGAAYQDPADRTRNSLRPVSNTPIPLIPPSAPYAGKFSAPPAMPGNAVDQSLSIYNFNYTLAGPDDIAPKKIYDDGKTTYFEFSKNVASPRISVLNPDGQEVDLSANEKDGPYNKTVSVNRIAGKFNISAGDKTVQVFNEQIRTLAPLNATGKN